MQRKTSDFVLQNLVKLCVHIDRERKNAVITGSATCHERLESAYLTAWMYLKAGDLVGGFRRHVENATLDFGCDGECRLSRMFPDKTAPTAFSRLSSSVAARIQCAGETTNTSDRKETKRERNALWTRSIRSVHLSRERNVVPPAASFFSQVDADFSLGRETPVDNRGRRKKRGRKKRLSLLLQRSIIVDEQTVVGKKGAAKG